MTVTQEVELPNVVVPIRDLQQNGKDNQNHESTLHPYLRFLERLKGAWKDCPDIYLSYEDLSYVIPVPIKDHGIPNILKAFTSGLKSKFHGGKKYDMLALAPCSGVIRPASMTLILAPPGHGKSTFLKALASRLNGDKHLKGSIKYNGLTLEEAKRVGVHVPRLCAFVAQGDLHFPTLTVHETLTFAAQNSVADVSLLGQPDLVGMDAKRADMLISLLGLDECANTILGDALLRGVSGGQKRRVTLGEMLITNARLFLLDEVSTGLDAAVTLHVFEALKKYTRICHGSIVTALLQPTPETYEQFDDVILMKDGHIVYHGPRESIKNWMKEEIGIPIPTGADEAGFLVDFLSDPAQMYRNMQDGEGFFSTVSVASLSREPSPAVVPLKLTNVPAPQQALVAASAMEINSSLTALARSTSVNGVSRRRVNNTSSVPAKLTTAEILAAYENTHLYKDMKSEITRVNSDPVVRGQLDSTKWSAYTRAQFGQAHPHGFVSHARHNISRQAKLVARNKTMIRPRVFQSILNGVIYGTLFMGLGLNDFIDKMGLCLFIVMNASFANLSELPVADEARNVVSKQLESGFFPVLSYMFSVVLLHIPLVMVEAFIFGSFMYWLPGFAPEAGRYFFFLLIYFCSSLGLSTFFRTISYSCRNPDVARQMDMPVILIFLVFGGFLIAYDKIPKWLIWVYWIDPLAYGVHSLTLNEFKSSQYDTFAVGTTNRLGDTYLESFGLDPDSSFKWGGVGFLLGFFLLFAFVSSWLLTVVKPPSVVGTKRIVLQKKSPLAGEAVAAESLDDSADDEEEAPQEVNLNESAMAPATATANAVVTPAPQITSVPSSTSMAPPADVIIPMSARAPRKATIKMTALPCPAVCLVWRNISYTVMVEKKEGRKKTMIPRVLLRDISGYALPGTLTALMGSSGAGKTTLMDVIAGRKTVGKIEGRILINGYDQDPHVFSRIIGYVEQQDLHIGTATVREALLLSAHLRLPAHVDKETRTKFVEEVMELVGLTNIADRLIGDIALPGLSPGQLKLVTIGVELVANPSILFLDEPTSGLDAPSAYRVMKAVRRIAATGRSVLCTIHQPSAELFLMFDRLLLLKTGGYDVYFGDVGQKGCLLVDYLETTAGPNGSRLPLGINPANWMLDVISPSENDAQQYPVVDFAVKWRESKLNAAAMEALEQASQPAPGVGPLVLTDKYVGPVTRYLAVQKRYFVSHWRNAPMNVTRFTLELIISLLFGLIYLQVDSSDFSGVNSLLAVIFLGMSFPASMAAGSAMPTFFRQRAVYYRERSSRMYNFLTYNLAMTVVELPYLFASVVIFIIPYYFMIGLRMDATAFFRYFLVIYIMSLIFSFLAMLWLALMPNQIVANIANGVIMGLFFIFGGMFIKPASIPSGWKWFYYIDPIPKAFIAAAMPQFYCEGAGCPSIEVPNMGTVNTYTYLSEMLVGYADQYGAMIGYLVLTLGVLRILNLLAGRYVNHIKR